MISGRSRDLTWHILILIGVWTIPALLGVAGYALGAGIERGGGGMRPSHYIAHSLALWCVWIPVTPIVFALHRRRDRIVEMALMHGVTLAAVLVAQSWLTVVVARATGHVLARFGFRENMLFAVENLLPYDALVYAGIVAAAVGIDYARRYRDRDLRASQLETQLERERLDVLQRQLQPHFLFNALNAITMLIRSDQKEKAVESVVGFSELLRYILAESGTMDVRVERELAFVRRYLDIARLRLGDSLQVSLEMGHGVESALMPNLLLQPLVENAVKHGVARGSIDARIRVRCDRVRNRLRLEVLDNGSGLPPDFELSQSGGIGLRNVRERLQGLCGPEAALTIGAAVGGGTSAVIELPFRTA